MRHLLLMVVFRFSFAMRAALFVFAFMCFSTENRYGIKDMFNPDFPVQTEITGLLQTSPLLQIFSVYQTHIVRCARWQNKNNSSYMVTSGTSYRPERSCTD
jgi:hypothetical protein